MTIVYSSGLINMGYSYNGEPFVDVPGKSSITLESLGYAWNAEPFMRNPAQVTTTTFLPRVIFY